MNIEEFDKLKYMAIKNLMEQEQRGLIQELNIHTAKKKVWNRLIAEKGAVTLKEYREELKKELKKD